MGLVYCFIINFNRLELPSRLADFAAETPGVKPVFLDNNSTYPPLLEYYKTCPHEVLKLGFNYGSAAPWHPKAGVLDHFDLRGGFIVTDPDLGIDHMPSDWLHELQTGLDRHAGVCKSGFGLMVDDLPDTEIGRAARKNQKIEWSHPLDGGRYFRSSIDTTFCLCRTRLHDFPAVRTNAPYLARHVPWYYTCLEDVPEDEVYYLRSITPRRSNWWAGEIRDFVGLEKIP